MNFFCNMKTQKKTSVKAKGLKKETDLIKLGKRIKQLRIAKGIQVMSTLLMNTIFPELNSDAMKKGKI